eukprot:scaffold93155_cov20-Tisochrysis_lutea.AAC.1
MVAGHGLRPGDVLTSASGGSRIWGFGGECFPFTDCTCFVLPFPAGKTVEVAEACTDARSPGKRTKDFRALRFARVAEARTDAMRATNTTLTFVIHKAQQRAGKPSAWAVRRKTCLRHLVLLALHSRAPRQMPAQEKCGATAIVDSATLTGACMVALGDEIAGLFSPTDAAAAEVVAAAKTA